MSAQIHGVPSHRSVLLWIRLPPFGEIKSGLRARGAAKCQISWSNGVGSVRKARPLPHLLGPPLPRHSKELLVAVLWDGENMREVKPRQGLTGTMWGKAALVVRRSLL